MKQFFNTLNNAFEVNGELLRIAESQIYRNKYKNKIVECKQKLDSIYEDYEILKEKVAVYDREYAEMCSLLKNISENSKEVKSYLTALVLKTEMKNKPEDISFFHRSEESIKIIDELLLQPVVAKSTVSSYSSSEIRSNISILDNLTDLIDDRLPLTPQKRLEILLKLINNFFSIPKHLEKYIKQLTINFSQSAIEAFCFRLIIYFQNQPNDKILTRKILTHIGNRFNIFLGSYNIPNIINCSKDRILILDKQRINYTGRILVDLSNNNFSSFQFEYECSQNKLVEEQVLERMVFSDVLPLLLRTSVEIEIEYVRLFDSYSLNESYEKNSMIIFDAPDIMKLSHNEIDKLKDNWIVIITDDASVSRKLKKLVDFPLAPVEMKREGRILQNTCLDCKLKFSTEDNTDCIYHDGPLIDTRMKPPYDFLPMEQNIIFQALLASNDDNQLQYYFYKCCFSSYQSAGCKTGLHSDLVTKKDFTKYE